MNINIKYSNIESTQAIKEYVFKRTLSLEKFMKGDSSELPVAVEIGKTTNHHKTGDFFKAEIGFVLKGKKFYAVSEGDDLYKAIDEVKEDIKIQLVETKSRQETTFRRGARSIKKMMKGLSKRNPFTAKYDK